MAAREAADRVWLGGGFALAAAVAARAVVVVVQADPTQAEHSAPCSPAEPVLCDGFAGFRGQLTAEAAAFAKPVLLLHGDSSPYCLDKGFGGSTAPKLWRLNGPGDYAAIDAVRITVDPDNAETPFAAETLLVGETPGPC